MLYTMLYHSQYRQAHGGGGGGFEGGHSNPPFGLQTPPSSTICKWSTNLTSIEHHCSSQFGCNYRAVRNLFHLGGGGGGGRGQYH